MPVLRARKPSASLVSLRSRFLELSRTENFKIVKIERQSGMFLERFGRIFTFITRVYSIMLVTRVTTDKGTFKTNYAD